MNDYLAEALSGLIMLAVLVIPCALIWHTENRRTRSRNNHPTNNHNRKG